jgi:hypothetical protein
MVTVETARAEEVPAVVRLGAAALLGLRDREYAPLCRWLLVTFPAGAIAELILGLVYARSF